MQFSVIELVLTDKLLFIYSAKKIRNGVTNRLRYELLPLAMKQSVATRNLVLFLEAQKYSMPDGGLQRVSSLEHRTILILRHAGKTRQQPNQGLLGGILSELRVVRRPIVPSAANVDVWARAPSNARIAPSHKHDIVLIRDLHTEPRNMLSYNPFRHITLTSTEAIINDVDNRRLARLRASRDDAKARFGETYDTHFARVTVYADGPKVKAHSRIPHAAKMVAVSPAAANHRATFLVAVTVSRISIVVLSSTVGVNDARFAPTLTVPPDPKDIA